MAIRDAIKSQSYKRQPVDGIELVNGKSASPPTGYKSVTSAVGATGGLLSTYCAGRLLVYQASDASS